MNDFAEHPSFVVRCLAKEWRSSSYDEKMEVDPKEGEIEEEPSFGETERIKCWIGVNTCLS